jgi:F-type H+-transporting ATPase subunit c
MKALKILALVLMVLFVVAVPVLVAQEHDHATPPLQSGEKIGNYPGTYILTGGAVGAGIGVALTIVGAGLGFGRIGSSALESMARQPEVAGQIQTAMLIIAALLEGATFFGLIVCILINGNVGTGL